GKTVDEILQTVSRQYFRVAHASRVLTPVRLGLSASRRNNLFLQKSALARRVRYPIKIEDCAAVPRNSLPTRRRSRKSLLHPCSCASTILPVHCPAPVR